MRPEVVVAHPLHYVVCVSLFPFFNQYSTNDSDEAVRSPQSQQLSFVLAGTSKKSFVVLGKSTMNIHSSSKLVVKPSSSEGLYQ
jgi:hypothetical protein